MQGRDAPFRKIFWFPYYRKIFSIFEIHIFLYEFPFIRLNGILEHRFARSSVPHHFYCPGIPIRIPGYSGQDLVYHHVLFRFYFTLKAKKINIISIFCDNLPGMVLRDT